MSEAPIGSYWAVLRADPWTQKTLETGLNPELAAKALNALQKEMILSPAAFDLLPRKFTVRQLQNLFEAVFGVEIDNRNFRKKLFSSDILIDTGEMETSVRHKPARLYTFNRNVFGKKDRPALNFMHILKYNKI